MIYHRCILFILTLLSVAPLQATPLRLDYSTTNIGGGLYGYDFSLTLDNNDGTYVLGQGWRWIIFGDTPVYIYGEETSPLSAFSMTSLVPAPWTSLSSAQGGHNGPSFSDPFDYWIPSNVGDLLSWSGTSTADLAQGELLFSTISGTLNGGVAANFEVAHRLTNSVPDATATVGLLGFSLLALIALRRKIR